MKSKDSWARGLRLGNWHQPRLALRRVLNNHFVTGLGQLQQLCQPGLRFGDGQRRTHKTNISSPLQGGKNLIFTQGAALRP